MIPELKSTLIGVAVALATDLSAFVNARKADRNAKYDFGLAFARAVLGGLIGFSGGKIPLA